MLRQIPRVARVATERAAASRELLLACAARLQPAPGVAAASQEIKVASASAAASSVAEVAGLGSRALQSAYSLASHPYSPSAWRTASPSAIASALATHRSGAASRLLQTASSASAYSSAVSVSPQELQALAQYRRAFATTTASLSEALRVEPVRKLRPDESDSSIWHTEGEPAPSPSAAAAAAAASGVEGTVAVGEPGAGSTSSVSGMAVGAIDPRMVIAFTCTNCDTHLVKTMSKKSYTQGVVLVRCDGCKSHHLIADHLGWFDDHGAYSPNFCSTIVLPMRAPSLTPFLSPLSLPPVRRDDRGHYAREGGGGDSR